MRKLAMALVALAVASMAWALPAEAEFGFKAFEGGAFNKDGSEAREAGSHPFEVKSTIEVKTKPGGVTPDGAVKTLRLELPAGLIGSRVAVPRCTTAELLTVDESGRPACPDASAIGATRLQVISAGEPGEGIVEAIYNLVPPPGVAAMFGFIAYNTPTTVAVNINDKQPFNVVAELRNIPQTVDVFGAETTIWGVPADPAHDPLRGRCLSKDPGPNGELRSVGASCKTGAAVVPFLTLPRSCSEPLTTSFEAVSWQEPNGPGDKGSFTNPPMFGCSKLGFSPNITVEPSASTAETASGIDVELEIDDEGLNNPIGLAQSEVKKAVVALPAGMTVNPSSANGLAACSRASYEAESLSSSPGQGCPPASKVGEVEVQSKLLAEGEALNGSVFLASQDDNPFGTLIALYMVIKSRDLGVLVKLPFKVEASEERGPSAGRLVTTVDEIPQIPFSHFRFHFTEGARGPLLTPPACGAYATEAQFTPWADPTRPITTTANFTVHSGVGGAPCPPGGVPPFNPALSAGSINNAGGAYSPFNIRLTRADGDQEMTRFDAVLPKGMSGKLAGVARCPDAAIPAAKAKSGRQELASPSCPASSEIGRSLAGAGVGAILTYVPGKLYLGGPVGKAPLSVISITPAVAGPFDVGTVVVRVALAVDPETAEVKVDSANSDPLPNILRGLPVKLKDLRVYTDRPNFTLNPTSCAVKEARATLFGSFLDPFSPADDVGAPLSDRYQASSCASLKFKPSIALRLKGGTKRGDHPAFRAELTYPKGGGYANARKAVITLPRSAFLEQAHIRTVCTRVQFAAESCPKGSVYGKARAFTPLLDEPLEGPVYLRSSSNPLPDMVIALRGLVDFNAVGRIDSANASIRSSFTTIPDAPLSKVVVELQGGKKGLIVNSRDLCARKSRAEAAFTAHNGKSYTQKPVVKAKCGGKKKR